MSTAAMAAVVSLTLVGRYAALGASPRFVFEVMVAVVGCALVPFVLRRPVPAALATVALSAASPAVTPPATFAVAYVARQRSLRTALLVGSAGVVAHLGQWALAPEPSLTLGWWSALDLVAHAALVAGGALLQARAALVQSLRERAQRAEADQQARLVEARAAERTEIAREMHDVLAHRLSLLATYAGALEFRPDAPPEQVTRAAGVLRQGVQDALNEVRDVIGVLRSDDDGTIQLRPQPRPADIDQLIEEARHHGMDVSVDGPVTLLEELPEPAGRAAYRLVQEGLTNARRHAPEAPVAVKIRRQPNGGQAAISISNPLPARAPAPSDGGSGLLGMTERIRLAGGHLEHGPRQGDFVVSASLPYTAPHPRPA